MAAHHRHVCQYPCDAELPGGEKNFKELLNEVKEETLEAFENQDYPFEDLVEQVAVNRDTGRNPLFDVMFVLPGCSTELKQQGEINQRFL